MRIKTTLSPFLSIERMPNGNSDANRLFFPMYPQKNGAFSLPFLCVFLLFDLFVLGLVAPCITEAQRGNSEVEILRDSWGIPHVFASNETDGFFGLGYACAEDRMLQMDLLRRRAAGRLAEVFGKDWVDSDREARIAGNIHYVKKAFTNLPTDMQTWLTAYASGVNTWIAEHPGIISRRFKTLDSIPEPWTPADCLLALRGLLSLGSPFTEGPIDQYYKFQELAALSGESEALQQFRMVVEDGAAIVSESEMAKDRESYQRLKSRSPMPGFLLQGAPGEDPKMSHAWAVSGSRSTTGMPILESDPQLPLSSPPFLHEFHLSAGQLDARGLGVPGCPGLFIGFNRRIAWGVSALGTDSSIVFLDRFTPDGKNYVFQDKAVSFERRLELIHVKGASGVVQEVLSNRHGVVFNSLARIQRSGEAYVLFDSQVRDCGTTARALLAFMSAGNWAEFCSAMECYYDPGGHVVYADVEGNIGYHTMVNRPLTVRSPRMAQEGWTGQQEIEGRIPFNELPHLLNPSSGFISHANNMPVGSWYPFDLGIGTGGNGHTGRSWRLCQLLEGERKFSLEDFESMIHRDDVNPLVAALLPISRKVVEEDKITDPDILRLLDSVKDWNLHAGTTDQFPAALALQNTLTPYRRAGLQNVFGAGSGGVTHMARKIASAFHKDGSTPALTAVREYLIDWLGASVRSGARRGGASDDWTVKISQGQTIQAKQQTIAIPYQKCLSLNLPTVDTSHDIVSPPITCLDTGTIWSQPGNFYTQIVDLNEIDSSRTIIAPGNSEDAESPFRTAGMEIWVKGGTHPAPLSRAKIEQLGATKTVVSVKSYKDMFPTKEYTIEKVEPEWRFVAAIPAVESSSKTETAKSLSGRKPDDPKLESAFRTILRQGTDQTTIDSKLDECRDYVKDNDGLTEQLRQAVILGSYLIEESATGRLKVPYGSPYVLEKLKELLKVYGEGQKPEENSTGTDVAKQRRATLSEISKPFGLMEFMRPDDLELVLEKAPIAYVPLGTFEHHGFHLPVCFDGIKAHALCERVAKRTGGTVLPTFFYGTGGGHIGYKWTNIVPEEQITPLLSGTLDFLVKQGFKTIVMLTGHYPGEQTSMVKRLVQEAQVRHPNVKFIGLSEPEITTPQPGDRAAGDHAAKYETSIALALDPEWVQMNRLIEGRDPSQIVLPETPRKEGTPYDPKHPLYAIHGQDPRTTASKELGEKIVAEIVDRLAAQVEDALSNN